jgi:hypothetical protein
LVNCLRETIEAGLGGKRKEIYGLIWGGIIIIGGNQR